MYDEDQPNHRKKSIIRRLLQRFSADRIEVSNVMTPRCESLLDIGCGDGSLLWSLAGKFNRGTGVDIAMRSPVWKQIEGRDKIPMDVVVANIDEGLSFKPSSYEVVTCIATLQHVFDPIHCMKEMTRVLRPGGYLVLQVPNIVYIRYRLNILFGSFPRISWREGWDGGTLHYFTKSSISRLLADHDFQIRQLSGSGSLCALRNWWPGLLTGDLIILAQKPVENPSSE